MLFNLFSYFKLQFPLFTVGRNLQVARALVME